MKNMFRLAAALLVAAAGPVVAQERQPQQSSSPQPFQSPSAINARHNSVLTQVQGFNIVLLVGESQASGGSIDDVPPAARKALNDMRDFLPFKHYRVLDSQWTSCCGDGVSALVRGQVQGAVAYGMAPNIRLGVKTYDFALHVGPTSSQRLSVTFALEEPRASGQNVKVSPAREAELEKRLSDLRREVDTIEDEIPKRQQTVGAKHPDLVMLQQQRTRLHQRIAETMNELSVVNVLNAEQRQHGGRRPLIDSNFTMDLGETVVVGTSRLGGDKALIAIVTAVKRGASR